MERHLDEELQQLNTNLLKMATLTEKAIHQSIEALKCFNQNLARQVIEEDELIDELELKIEEEIIEVLALFQPMASDLRFIVTGLHINNELERIADLTVNIAQRVVEIAEKPEELDLDEIPRLAEHSKVMIKQAIDAFVNRSEEVAKKVIFSDKASNSLRTSIINRLIYDVMMTDGGSVPTAVPLLLATRDLERICDLAASIAEDVIYMVNAKVVKHHRELLHQDGSDSLP